MHGAIEGLGRGPGHVVVLEEAGRRRGSSGEVGPWAGARSGTLDGVFLTGAAIEMETKTVRNRLDGDGRQPLLVTDRRGVPRCCSLAWLRTEREEGEDH